MSRHAHGRRGPRRLLVCSALAVAVVAGLPIAAPLDSPRLGSVRDAIGAVPTPQGPADEPVAARAIRPPTAASGSRLGERPAPTAPERLTGYGWPLPRGRLTLPFGPSPWGSRLVDGEPFHDGIDLATFCGDRIVAAHAGTVIAAGRRYDEVMGWRGDLGPYLRRLEKRNLWMTLPIVVVIDDGNGYRSIYAHFGRIVVKRGQVVKAGQLLGYEGATGRASGCHLHYGLFAPNEEATFGISREVARRMRLPALQTARVDPLLVLPIREIDRDPEPQVRRYRRPMHA